MINLSKIGATCCNHDHKLVKRVDEDDIDLNYPEYLDEELVPYIEQEKDIAGILALAFAGFAAGVIADILRAVDQQNIDKIQDAVAAAARQGAEIFDKKTAKDIDRLIRKAIANGEKKVLAGSLAGNPAVERIATNLTRQTGNYLNGYFSSQVIPTITKELQKIYTMPNPLAQPSYAAVRELVESSLESTGYWKIVANATTSRAYHYGLIESGLEQGYVVYRLVAVLDNRTSEICRELDGTEFFVSDASVVLERAARAETTEELAAATPWLKASDVEDKTAEQLEALGVLVPPFHANCRTTLVLVQ